MGDDPGRADTCGRERRGGRAPEIGPEAIPFAVEREVDGPDLGEIHQ